MKRSGVRIPSAPPVRRASGLRRRSQGPSLFPAPPRLRSRRITPESPPARGRVFSLSEARAARARSARGRGVTEPRLHGREGDASQDLLAGGSVLEVVRRATACCPYRASMSPRRQLPSPLSPLSSLSSRWSRFVGAPGRAPVAREGPGPKGPGPFAGALVLWCSGGQVTVNVLVIGGCGSHL